MKLYICPKNIKQRYFMLSMIAFLFLGCSQGEDYIQADTRTIAIPVEIKGLTLNLTKSIGTQPYTVNRVFILPFKKVDESVPENEDGNFRIDMDLIKQVAFNTSPAFLTMLDLTEGATYKILAVGYNSNDFDENIPGNNKFLLPFTNQGALDFAYLRAVLATDIPDIFTATGISYNGENPFGEFFKPEEIRSLKIGLNRMVSGLNLEITNIPGYVASITLVAEKLVEGLSVSNFKAFTIRDGSDADATRTFSTQIPEAGNVRFNHYLLPTLDVNRTKFYLDIELGSQTERYLIRVNDIAGISSGNSIAFYPNHVVKISGDYSRIDLGFTLNYSIHLDDNKWDGLQ